MRVSVVPEASRPAVRQPDWVKRTIIIIKMHATGRSRRAAGDSRFPMSRHSVIFCSLSMAYGPPDRLTYSSPRSCADLSSRPKLAPDKLRSYTPGTWPEADRVPRWMQRYRSRLLHGCRPRDSGTRVYRRLLVSHRTWAVPRSRERRRHSSGSHQNATALEIS